MPKRSRKIRRATDSIGYPAEPWIPVRFWWSCLAVILWVVAIFMGLTQPELLLADEVICCDESKNLVPAEARSYVEDYKSDLLFGYIPRDGIVLFPRKALQSQLRADFPEAVSLDVSYAPGRRVRIKVEDRTPEGLACLLDAHAVLGERCLLFDEKGVAYAPAPYYSDGLVQKIYMGELPADEELPADITSKEQIKGMAEGQRILEEMGMTIHSTRITWHENTYMVSRIGTLVFKEPVSIIMTEYAFSDPKELQSSVNLLESALSEGPLYEGILAGDDSLEYIDTRFGNNVYYRFNKSNTRSEERPEQES